jgi:hypothetical protein
MRFMAVFEWDPKDIEKIKKKRQQVPALRKKFPDKFPKSLDIASRLGGNTKSFSIYETDDEEQLLNFQEHWTPEVKIKWIPLIGSRIK